MVRILQIILILQTLIVTNAPIWANDCEPEFEVAVSAKELARKKAYLRQNDGSKLIDDQCGGTCVSITMTNAILVLKESFDHGSILGIAKHFFSAKPELVALQDSILSDILQNYRSNTGRTGLDGAYLREFQDILPLVYENQFGTPPFPITVSPVKYSAFQSVESTQNSLIVLSVAVFNSAHAVLAHSIRKADKADHFLYGDVSFIITVHDPLFPYLTRDLGVYEKNGVFYLMNYYATSPNRSLDLRGKGLTAVSAARINEAIVISINQNDEQTQKWNTQRAKDFASIERRVNITTSAGYTYVSVRIPPKQFPLWGLLPKKNLIVEQRFSKVEVEVPYSDIHSIEFE